MSLVGVAVLLSLTVHLTYGTFSTFSTSDSTCPPEAGCTCTQANLGLPAGFPNAYESVSDHCFGGCMLLMDDEVNDKLTQIEAIDKCVELGGELIRWNGDLCFDDIAEWLNCQGYNDSMLFWTSADLEVEPVEQKLKNKVWKKKVGKLIKLFNADDIIINEQELSDTSFRGVILHFKSNGAVVTMNLPAHSKNMYICMSPCDEIIPPPPPPPGGNQSDPVDCSLNPSLCNVHHPICMDFECHGCDPNGTVPCTAPRDKCLFNPNGHGVWDCGDPHVVVDASNSDYPVCYGLYGVAQRFYRLIDSISCSIDAEMDYTHVVISAPHARFTVKLRLNLPDGSTILFTSAGVTVNGIDEYNWGSPYSVEIGGAYVKFLDAYTAAVDVGAIKFNVVLVGGRLDFYLIDGSLDMDAGMFGAMARARIEPTLGAVETAVLYVDGVTDDVTLGSRNDIAKCWLLEESSPVVDQLLLDYCVTNC